VKKREWWQNSQEFQNLKILLDIVTRKPVRPNEEAVKAVMLFFTAFFVLSLSPKSQTLLLDFENGQRTVYNNCSSTMMTYSSSTNPLSGSISLRTFWMARNNAGPMLDTPEFYADGDIYVTTKAVSTHHDPHMWVYSINPGLGNHNLVGGVQYTDTFPRTDTFRVYSREFIRIYWVTNTASVQPVPLWDQIVVDDIISHTPNACSPLNIHPDTIEHEETFIEKNDECVYIYYSIGGKLVGERDDYITQPPGMYVKRCTLTGTRNIVVKLE